MPDPVRSPVSRWLARRDGWTLNLFAIAAAFSTYFCMYAFRKPFAAATFEGQGASLMGLAFDAKNLFIIAQLLGYALSKYLGVRVNSEVSRQRRFVTLVGLIIAAEAALLLFGAIPSERPVIKSLALFANGLPLGMVWGLVVQYLEGRRLSEVLLTGLSCSYILASGVVKDVGRTLMAGGGFDLLGLGQLGVLLPNPLPPIAEYWMPAATGALFFPAFLLSAWLLEQLPPPSERDESERVRREPMPRRQRREFLSRYALAIVAALAVYFALTAFRDYRDTYMVEAFNELGYDYEANRSVVSRAETLVALGVAAILSQLYRFRDNRLGIAATYAVMAGGLLLMGFATFLLDSGMLSGFWWMTLIGLGAYLAYIPFGALLFDRAIACSGYVGTAVFTIYVADAVGYTGSVALYVAKGSLLEGAPHLAVIRGLSYVVAFGGAALLGVSCFSFLGRSVSDSASQRAADGVPTPALR